MFIGRVIRSNNAPLVFDVRKKPAFDSSPQMIETAKWQQHDEALTWSTEFSRDKKIVVYCVQGMLLAKTLHKH